MPFSAMPSLSFRGTPATTNVGSTSFLPERDTSFNWRDGFSTATDFLSDAASSYADLERFRTEASLARRNREAQRMEDQFEREERAWRLEMARLDRERDLADREAQRRMDMFSAASNVAGSFSGTAGGDNGFFGNPTTILIGVVVLFFLLNRDK